MANYHLDIYKASAGSGKTFTLAVNFIRMLIESPDDYRHILAVTFTNKATAEMKQRILSKLYGIAYNTSDAKAYYNAIQETTELPEETIRQRACEALDLLIHDYSHLRVETIDSFFQSVLRGLARELDLGTGMTIELDTTKVISEAVDLMLRELKPGDAALDWIVSYITDEIDEGQQWNITYDVKKFAGNIHNESYQRKADELRQQLQTDKVIQPLRSHLMTERAKAIRLIEERATDFFSLIEKYGYSIDEFSNKSAGACGYYLKIQRGEYTTELSPRYQAAANDAKGWVSASSKIHKELYAFADAHLVPHINETHRLCCQYVPVIYTCDLVTHHLNQLQLIDIIHDRVLRLNREENRFLLADTCQMLSHMQQGDSSFVFEKLGYYIEHIMIDEFQDTSRMQWDNFFVLLLEGLSRGKRSLLVGDVKQAIYRWRGSDWRILNEEVQMALQRYTSPKAITLDTNRRSLRGIVEFNNMLFAKCNTLLACQLGEGKAHPLLQAYADVEQQYLPDKEGGYVRISNIVSENDESSTDAMCRAVAEQIIELRQADIADSQMSILTRTNTQIAHMVDYMGKHHPDIHLFSADAYLLEASTAVTMLIAALRWISDEQQRFSLLQLAIDYHREVLADGLQPESIIAMESTAYGLPEALTQERLTLLQTPLYELTEKLYRMLGLSAIAHEDGYMMTFFDRLQQFCTDQPGNITDFLHHWDEELHKATIPAGSSEGIQAMTIHKSKGLEFHTVILPFCNWSLNKYKGLLWVETDDPMLENLATVPIPYGKKMTNSIFTNQHDEELLQQTVDNYNLLYVACTRPKCNLIILKPGEKSTTNNSGKEKSKPKKTDDNIGNVGKLISRAINMDTDIVEYGNLYVKGPETETNTSKEKEKINPFEVPSTAIAVEMHSEELTARFRQSNQSKRYIPEEEDDNTMYMEQGLLLHEVLSRMSTAADASTAIDQLMREGLIGDDSQRKGIERTIAHALQLPEAADWFSGKYELFNECSIIYKQGGKAKVVRPDRVMKHDNRIIVVDFKFARPNHLHEEQVSNYMERLQEMGYRHVEGYVWYAYANRVIPVYTISKHNNI